ncbi:MAG: restriction endonuclease [Pontixanthobacter sp.]
MGLKSRIVMSHRSVGRRRPVLLERDVVANPGQERAQPDLQPDLQPDRKQGPQITAFGLPAHFDLVAHDEMIAAIRMRTFAICAIGLAVIACLLAIMNMTWKDGLSGLLASFVVNTAFLCAGFVLVRGHHFAVKIATFISHIDGTRRKVAAFRNALADHEYNTKVTGAGFWQALRGVELEVAAARLFEEKDWTVRTTATTGDGGIDLVLCKGSKQFWCQCKGYAKPVSVSAVREIAGVCSSSEASPMLLVVNGVTNPAAIEAKKFAVAIWDAEDLASYAKVGVHRNADAPFN